MRKPAEKHGTEEALDGCLCTSGVTSFSRLVCSPPDGKVVEPSLPQAFKSKKSGTLGVSLSKA